MSRPQATTAFIPISNRSRAPRPHAASAFMSPEQAAATQSWYNITSKKAADKVVAEVMIYGEIGWEVTASQFVKDLTLLEADAINVRINSVGGDVFDGVAIYNALRMKDAQVTVYVEGLAASAASFIAQAGDEVVMLRGSQMMIHDASAFAWGNEEVMRQTGEILGKISNSIADIYAQRAGGTTEEWRAIMRAEMWYSPEEAVSAGLADNVLDDENEDAQKAKNGWDLQVFNYAGRKEAPNPLEETRKIINRVQEDLVTPKNDTTEGTATPPAPPETPAPDPAPVPDQPVEQPDEEEGDTPPEAPEAPAPVEEPAPPVQNTVTSGMAFFMVNGQQVSDPKAVQAHITALENAQREQKETARKEFINNLAATNRIAATQIEAMEELVATMDDKQYGLWCASWNAAPNVPLLGSHGPDGGGNPSGTAAEAVADRVSILMETVKRHKMSGMKTENIVNTNSYKELMKLKPDFTLDTL